MVTSNLNKRAVDRSEIPTFRRRRLLIPENEEVLDARETNWLTCAAWLQGVAP